MGSVLWLGWKPKSDSPILFCSAELGCSRACCPSGLTLHAAQLAPPAAGLGNGRTSKSKRLGFAVSNLVHCTWSSQLLVPFLSSFLKRSWCLWVEIPPSKVLLGSLTAQVQPGPSSGVVVLGPSHHAASQTKCFQVLRLGASKHQSWRCLGLLQVHIWAQQTHLWLLYLG